MILANAVPEGFFEKSLWIFQEYAPLFWYGVKITLMLAVLGTLFGLVIGLLLGSIRAIKIETTDSTFIRILKKFGHRFVAIYVWFFRGTPMMVQAMFLYSALRPFLHWTPNVAGIIIISINTGAYMAEIMRSGIQSIDAGQSEAARSLGMSNIQTMLHIILPQAIRNAFPSIGNEFIVNIKDSCMLNCIGVLELYFQSSSVAGSVFLFTETFLVTTIMYLVLTSLATIILGFIERKMNLKKASVPMSQTMPKAGGTL